MMSLSSFSEKYFSQKKAWRSLLLLGFIVISLPLVIVLILQQQDLRQRADASSAVVFLDGSNNEISQTSSSQVKVKLTSPWGIKPLSMAVSDITVLGQASAIYQTLASTDDVNEVNGKIDSAYGMSYKTIWVGNGESSSSSYAGLRFTNISIPKNARVISAQIQLRPEKDTWIGLGMQIYGEASGNSTTFSTTVLPSNRTATTKKVTYTSNSKWVAGRWYMLSDISPVIQEIVSRGDWNAGNSLSVILKGTGGKYQRKFVYSFDGNPQFAPRLSVVYETDSSVPTTTIIPTKTPSATVTPTSNPSNTPVPPTPISYIESITLAEDAAFTQNVKQISPITENPLITDYIFSNASPGPKTIYAKFHSTIGNDQVYSSSISLVSQATPTVSASGQNSMAMGKWNPNTKYDTCPSYPAGITTDQQKVDYIKSIHDSYKVKGPDGKWYPTWHPPVDPVTKCKLGHEHGRDPKGSEMWKTKQIQNYFFYDENKNGIMDSSEEAVTGLPFGYVNEQLDAYNASHSMGWMRHEDHVGHKVEYANGEGDIATHHGEDLTGGVYVQKNSPITRTTVKCYYLAKPHQGVSSPDAFTNNIHEVFYFSDCRDETNPANNQKVSTAMMEGFGKVGGFTNFMPMCGVERRSDPQDFITLGTTEVNSQYPNGDGDREIITRECIEKGFLVPEGQWSGNMYEAWPASLSVETSTGKQLVSGINLLFDVEDANRYFYPDSLKAQRGYNNPDAKPNLGFTMDLCYDTSLLSQGRKYRGGPCDYATNYGQIKGITWDDPRSGFRGLHRGMYFQAPVIENAGGSETWYSDPFGKNASTTQFAGAVKQQITTKNLNYGQQFGFPTDPSVVDRTHEDGNRTVHAPN